MKPIKIIQLFESYPVFYQPYIPPVMEALKRTEGLAVKIQAFKGHPEPGVKVMPSYLIRRLYERWYQIFHPRSPELQYNEILSLKQKTAIIQIQHSFLFPKILGLLQLPKAQRPKIVISLRGGDTYVKPWINRKWKAFYQDHGHLVDAFVVMSQHQKQYLHKQWGVAEGNIHVIPISFGTGFKATAKYPDEKKIKIVSVFRMCWEKNIAGNLQVITCLKVQGLPVHYTVYGDGPDLGQLYYLVDALGLGDVVEIKGKVPHTQIQDALASYDFILQLSLSESLGMSVIEAQSVGIPAIVSNSSGLPEALLQNESGYCVEAHDAISAAQHIETLWKDRRLYSLFSQKAIEFSHQHFTIDNEVSKLKRLYQDLVST
ncbi:glycosyltransferase involved in cell wall biosynthesis [Flavobacteriaceae bacterium MAR_2010_105]|nr:glycosyltransferase involved in cell wall biosynthesis [Flavobacteriaceae bacterium MAR_2010_105]